MANAYGSRMSGRIRPVFILLAVLSFCLLVFLATLRVPRIDNQLIGSDGIRYYAYLRSLVIDHDLDFSNEFTYFYGAQVVDQMSPTPTGRLANVHAIGSSFLWSPLFLITHAIMLLGRSAGLPVVADGYGYPYQVAISLESMLYGFIGLLLSFRLARQYAGEFAALVATLVIWLCGNTVYYMTVEPSMAHMNSLFCVALFLYFWHSGRGSLSYKRWLILGLLAGLMTLVRTQDGLFIIAPLWELAEGFLRRSPGYRPKEVTLAALIMGGGLLVTLIPQSLAWQVIFGNPLVSPYARGGGFAWTSPHFLDVLFALRHGLFVWHPVFLLALAGLGLLFPRARSLAMILLVCFLGQVFILGSWGEWWLGDAFGMRALINCTIIFVLGLSVLIEKVHERLPAPYVWGLASLFLIWNALFMVQYRFGFISMSQPVTLRQLSLDKLTVPLRLVEVAHRLTGQ